jgi:hypothetical protein
MTREPDCSELLRHRHDLPERAVRVHQHVHRANFCTSSFGGCGNNGNCSCGTTVSGTEFCGLGASGGTTNDGTCQPACIGAGESIPGGCTVVTIQLCCPRPDDLQCCRG